MWGRIVPVLAAKPLSVHIRKSVIWYSSATWPPINVRHVEKWRAPCAAQWGFTKVTYHRRVGSEAVVRFGIAGCVCLVWIHSCGEKRETYKWMPNSWKNVAPIHLIWSLYTARQFGRWPCVCFCHLCGKIMSVTVKCWSIDYFLSLFPTF